MFSGLSNFFSSPARFISTVLALAVVVLSWSLRRAYRKTNGGVSGWKNYLGGQGMLVFVFLMSGAFLAWLSLRFGPHPGLVTQGKMTEFHVDPSKAIVIEEQDAQSYPHIEILTRTKSPKGSSAVITVYGDSANGAKTEMGHIEATESAWSKWERSNSSNRLTITVATGNGTEVATMVDLFVFLSAK